MSGFVFVFSSLLDISTSNAFLSVTFLLKTDHSFAGFHGKKKIHLRSYFNLT